MGKIVNVGLLDTRSASEETLKMITEISNVGMLLVTDESQLHLENCKRTNIGTTMKISEEIQVIECNGNITIDFDFLDGISDKVVILVNGNLIIKNDVKASQISDKIHTIVINGTAYCPSDIKGSLGSKGMINGMLIGYKNDHNLIQKSFDLTDQFLKGLKDKSRIAISDLTALVDIDLELLGRKIDSIQILGDLIVSEKNVDALSELVYDYNSVNKQVILSGDIYVNGDLQLTEDNIRNYTGSGLIVKGTVTVSTDESTELSDYLTCIQCDKIICENYLVSQIKSILSDENIEIETDINDVLKNTGKLLITEDFLLKLETPIILKNMGKLVFEESLSYGLIKETISKIDNYGVIIASQSVLNSLLGQNIKKNKGMLRSFEDVAKESIENDVVTLYANTGKVVL